MRRSFIVSVLVTAAIIGCTAVVKKTPDPRRPDQTPTTSTTTPNARRDDIRNSPPVAQRAAVRLLESPADGNNAVAFVEFAPGRPTPPVVTIELEQGRRATLRDDGATPDEQARDGIHSGFVFIDVAQLERSQQRVAAGAARTPIFVGRELVAHAVPAETSLDEQTQRGSGAATVKQLPILPTLANPIGKRPRPGPGEIEIVRIPFDVRGRLRPDIIIPIFPLTDPASIDPQRSLLITDPGVINDPARTFNPCTSSGTPMGNWTFGHLFEEMANSAQTGITPADFARRWIRRWEIGQVVNDFPVPARAGTASAILSAWPTTGSPAALDLSRAPFKLVAIVNRIDLRQNTIYGGGSAGEARFVFALTDSSCNPLPFLVIFEYGINRPSCTAVKAWGQQWADLANHPVGSAAYNAALEAITLQFTEAGTNPAQIPNRNSLSQLRTNEFITSPWELREFRLAGDDSDVGHLREVTVKQTPDLSFNNTTTLANYANANAADIVQDRHTVPISFAGNPFLGGAAPVPALSIPPTFHWDGPPPAPSASMSGTANLRHHLSLNTCNGCHAGETRTTFTHISQTGALSGFLTGISVTDPAGEGVTRNFNDLLRRQTSLAQLLDQPCFFKVFHDPIRMVH